MTQRLDDLKSILLGFYREDLVAELLPRIEKHIPPGLELNPDILIDIELELEEFFDEKPEEDLPCLYQNIIIDQIKGKISVKREPLKSSETVEINVSYEDAKIWLGQDVCHPQAKIFIETLKNALKKNLGPFEVPIGEPKLDLWGRLTFESCNSLDDFKAMRNDFSCNVCNYYQAQLLGKYNGWEVCDEDRFMLYLVYLMNQYANKSGEKSENIFDAVIADDDFTRCDFETTSRIRLGMFGPKMGLCTAVKNGEKFIAMALASYCRDEVNDECNDLGPYLPFYIKGN